MTTAPAANEATRPAQAGLVLMPGSLMLSLSFPLAGRVADRFERRVVVLFALSVFALSSYLFTFLSLDWPRRWIVWLVMLRFSCGSFVYAPMTATALSPTTTTGTRFGVKPIRVMFSVRGPTGRTIWARPFASVVALAILAATIWLRGVEGRPLGAAAVTLLGVQGVGEGLGVLSANLVTIVFVLTQSHVVFLTSNRWNLQKSSGE